MFSKRTRKLTRTINKKGQKTFLSSLGNAKEKKETMTLRKVKIHRGWGKKSWGGEMRRFVMSRKKKGQAANRHRDTRIEVEVSESIQMSG